MIPVFLSKCFRQIACYESEPNSILPTPAIAHPFRPWGRSSLFLARANDIAKPKKTEMTRVADVQLQLRKTDPKKAKYDMLIQVDDSKLEKKDRTANEPVQFLVGRDKLRYEIVVNYVDKDRIRGYLSTPKDKVLSAEKPQFRPE